MTDPCVTPAPVHSSSELQLCLLTALEGDALAYRRFLDQLAQVLSGYFKKRVFGSQDEVADLVQETVLAVHRRRYSYRPDVPVMVWIYAIARHKHIDWLRTHGRSPATGDWDESMSPCADLMGVWQVARDMRLLISRLPRAQGHLLAYTKLMGYSVEETAELMGMSQVAVKVGVHRAMKSLSKMLGGVLHEI